MIARLKTLFAPPVFANDKRKTRTASILNIVLWLLVTAVTILLISLIRPGNVTPTVISLLSVDTILIACLVLVHYKYLTLPSLLLPTVLLISITFIFYNGEGIHDIAILAYPFIIILAGLLLGKYAVFIFSTLSTASAGLLVYTESMGIITPTITPIKPIHFFIAGIMLIVFTLTIHLLMDLFTKSIRETRQNEQEMNDINQQLAILQADLENQVEERTYIAKQAQKEAVTANKTLAHNAWLATGQAKLNEQILGLTDPRQLAQTTITFLCNYSDAQMGALFLCTGNTLTLTGRYAYDNRYYPDGTLMIGDGLVGQAALEKKMLTLTNPTADYLLIQVGLVTAVPHQIIASPFLINDHLVGVVELAYLNKISPDKLAFLTSTMPNIAIALNVLQLRQAELAPA